MPTYTYTGKALTNAEAEAKSGTSHRTQVPYADRLSDLSTPYTRLGAENRRLDQVYNRLELGLGLACEQTAALKVVVRPGRYRKSDGTPVTAPETEITCTNNATNYVRVDVATNTVTSSTAGWPATEGDYVPVAIAVTSGGQITSIEDARGYLHNRIPPTVADSGSTNQPTFTLDADNAGAGATTGVRFNRGTDGGGEDAEARWDETNDRFELRSQHTTGTLAELNALGVRISGTMVLDGDGAAKVAAAVAGNGLTHSAGVLSANVDGATLETSADAIRVKDSGISAAKLSDAVVDKLAQVTVSDSAGGSPRTVTIQVKDLQGNNLAEVCYLALAVCQDADGAALATNATIAIGGTGSLVRSLTATKELVIKTDANGAATVTITDATLETVYVIASATRRSKLLDCADIGTVTIS